jgi:hypothetical protein
MNPNTSEKSLHLYHSTGSGKTLGSLNVAQSFTKAYSKIEDNSPTVFILGFAPSQKAFRKELMRFPEFGIITQEEILMMKRKEQIAASGLPDDIKQLKDFKNKIKRRITNKEKGGYYQFLGYEELVNRLFYLNGIKLQDLEDEAAQKNTTLEAIFQQHIGIDIEINGDFLTMFNNSLIICDEVHITYNNARKNDRGIALSYVISTAINVRLLTLSATPYKGVPKEAIDWINYHMAARKKPLITKEEFFQNDNAMYPHKLEEFGKLTRGFVSFFQDINKDEYPERIFEGKTIAELYEQKRIKYLPEDTPLNYLKFIDCPMSPIHQKTYDNYMQTGNTTKIASNARALLDCVFPNPRDDSLGLCKSSEINGAILSANAEWRNKKGVEVRKHNFGSSVLTGKWLTDIGKYSSKYGILLQSLISILSNNRGEKIIIYHNKVKTSGVLFIQEVLLQNGFIDEFSNPTDYTRCWLCGEYMANHGVKNLKKEGHNFIPARFITVFHKVNSKLIDTTLDKFNHPSNAHGHNYGILLGSKIISESYDFKDIQHLIIVSVPVNISSLIQIFGRAIRKNASIALPPDQRKTIIQILVSTIALDAQGVDNGYEMESYQSKLANYRGIQLVEHEVMKNAIDFSLHWKTIMKNVSQEDFIGTLWENKPEIPRPTELNLARFNNYEYGDAEVRQLIYLIKRIFLDEPVWTYDDLLVEVKKPRVPLINNPQLFSENNFKIALKYLLNDIMVYNSNDKLDKFVESLFNPYIRIIYKNNIEHKIKAVGKYYILFPVNIFTGEGVLNYKYYIHNVVDDLESYLIYQPNKVSSVDIEEYLSQTHNDEQYNLIKKDIQARLAKDDFNYFILYEYSEKIQTKLLEDIISGSATGLSKKTTDSIIDLYLSLGAIVMTDEVIVYKNVGKYYENNLKKGIPIGYCLRNIIRLFTTPSNGKNKWIELDKIELNRQFTFKSNNIITGYLQDENDVIKFKLIEVHQTVKKDKRLNTRGMVCSFYDKDNIFEIAASLGISLKKLNPNQLKSGHVCELIRNALISREIRERSKNSYYYWIRGWWS